VAASDEARYARQQQLETLFPVGDKSLGVSLNNALNAWSAVASSPTDTTARTVLIARSEEFAARVRDMTANLDELRQSSTLELQEAARSVNSLAQQIAAVNERIVQTQGSGRTPNDLLDQRDQLVSQLNQYVQTSTVAADNGSLTVFIGGSQPLVLGSRASTLEVLKGDPDANQVKVAVNQAGQLAEINPDFLGGGSVKGLVSFVNEDLPESYNNLGRMVLTLSEQINAQHRLGLDANGNAGTNFFQINGAGTAGSVYSYNPSGAGPISIAATPINGAPATLSASISDVKSLQPSDYQISFTDLGGGNLGVRVVRLSDKQVALETSLGTSPLTLPMDVTLPGDGLTLTLGTEPAPGDSYLLQPYADAARNIDVAISAAENIAVASSVRVDVASTNSGTLQIDNLAAVGTPPTGWTGSTITFNALGQYSVDGGAFTTFQPGQPITANGFQIVLRGVPTDGDTFTISPAGVGDVLQNAGNAKAILNLRDSAVYGGVTLGDSYIPVFSALANKVQSGKTAAQFSTTAATNAATAKANQSGVNLDEEAARLMQYQQAYQASAKMLQIAQSVFDTLIQNLGR
jgi:flagellar hook-associated protein 1 FlgK